MTKQRLILCPMKITKRAIPVLCEYGNRSMGYSKIVSRFKCV